MSRLGLDRRTGSTGDGSFPAILPKFALVEVPIKKEFCFGFPRYLTCCKSMRKAFEPAPASLQSLE